MAKKFVKITGIARGRCLGAMVRQESIRGHAVIGLSGWLGYLAGFWGVILEAVYPCRQHSYEERQKEYADAKRTGLDPAATLDHMGKLRPQALIVN